MNINNLLNGEITQEEFMVYNNIKILDRILPKRIYGFIFNHKNYNFIVINRHISEQKKKETLLHEFAHIELNHLSKKDILEFKIENIEDEADKYIKFIKEMVK